MRLRSETRGRDLTADFLWAAADVVGQADDHLRRSMAHRHRHIGAVVLHWDDGVVVAAVHAAGILGGFPHLTVCTRNTRTVSAGCFTEKNKSLAPCVTSDLLLTSKLGSYHTSLVRCRGPSTAGGGGSPLGTRSPPSGLNTGRGPSRSRGWGRTARCRPADRPDTAECRDTGRLQEETHTWSTLGV